VFAKLVLEPSIGAVGLSTLRNMLETEGDCPYSSYSDRGCVSLWLAHDEVPGPYITIPQYGLIKQRNTNTKRETLLQ